MVMMAVVLFSSPGLPNLIIKIIHVCVCVHAFLLLSLCVSNRKLEVGHDRNFECLCSLGSSTEAGIEFPHLWEPAKALVSQINPLHPSKVA